MNLQASIKMSMQSYAAKTRQLRFTVSVLAGAYCAAVIGLLPAAQPPTTNPTSASAKSVVDAEEPAVAAKTNADRNAFQNHEIRESGPELFYLRDKAGDLVPVPAGITIEDFQRLYRIDQGLRQPDFVPKYIIEQLKITGSANKEQAELRIEFVIATLTDSAVRIPLGMGNAILRDLPRDEGSAQVVIDFDRRTSGYVAWVRAGKNEKHRLVFDAILPVQRVASRNVINLETPHCALSQMVLTLTAKEPEIVVSDNAEIVSTDIDDDNKTRVTLAGVAGVVRFAWTDLANDNFSQSSSFLEVDSILIARVRGPNSLRTEASFRIQSLGQTVDTVRVRLPAGAQMISSGRPDYTVTIDESEGNAEQLVAVFKLAKATREQFTLQLLTEQMGVDDDKPPLNAGGFFVENAFRHVGHLAIAVEGEWLPRWSESTQLRPSAKIPAELQSEEFLTVFRYFRQPFDLPLTAVKKQTRMSVEPRHIFKIDPHRVELRARFQFTVHGAPTKSIQMQFHDWEVIDVLETNLVDIQSLDLTAGSPLTIPLAQAMRGKFDLEILARRTVQPTDNSLLLKLPYIVDASAAQAVIVVLPAENIELESITDETSRLRPERMPADLRPANSEQSSICRRLVDSPENAQLAYRIRFRPRHVNAEVTSQIDIEHESVSVDQQFSLYVRHEPLDRVILRIPPVIDHRRLELQFDGNTIEPKDDPELTNTLAAMEAEDTANMYYAVYDLASGPQGDVVVNVTYPLPFVLPRDTSNWTIPLVLPHVDEVSSHRVIANSPAETALRTTDANWEVNDNRHRATPANQLFLTAKGSGAKLNLQISPAPELGANSTSIKQAYVQTWTIGTARRDRAVFRFSSNENRLPISLPRDVLKSDEVFILLDHKRVSPYWRNDAIVEIDLSAVAVGEHVLELSYGVRQPTQRWFSSIELPHIMGAHWTQELYWQLVTPEREHLFTSPNHLISANSWEWRGLIWGRQPEHEQEWLEEWIGASVQTPPPPATNRYLFTTFGDVERLDIIVLSRTTFVLFAASAAFFIGFLFLSFAWMRQPLVVLSMLFALVVGAVVMPLPILTVGPLVVLGLVMAILVPSLRGFINRRTSPLTRKRVTTPSRSTSIRQIAKEPQSLVENPNATTTPLRLPVQDV